MSFDRLFKFEQDLAEYTGAPYVVVTDGCTHAIELCLRYDRPQFLAFTAFTYLSIPMLMHHLQINYILTSEQWQGEYQFHGTRIWDSARLCRQGMYREGQMQCLSFGHTKPLHIGRGGAILLDDEAAYNKIIRMRYDGRDLSITPWNEQLTFRVGYHYKPTIEEAERCLELLPKLEYTTTDGFYPDCRNIQIVH